MRKSLMHSSIIDRALFVDSVNGEMSTKVKFVVDGSAEQDLMLKAALSVQSARLPTEKISSKDVVELKSKDKHLYVCGQFSGQAFDHLVNIKCRIVGPQCVISCLELQIAVPNVPHPINNIAMQNVVVSCSSIERAQRTHIHQLLEWMGGRVSKDLTEMVTHLVVGEVGSKKYHVAANVKKQIMLPEWITVAWQESQTKHFSASEESFLSQYRCPAFKGCIVCVTGVETSLRQDVRKRVPEFGGYYTGELKYNECTHLIVGTPRGAKFEFARKWKIHTVSINWFYDSIEAGYCLDEQLYNVISQEQPTSTPVKSNENQPRLSTLVDISAINVSSIHPVDDTAISDTNVTMETSRLAPPPLTGLNELENLDLAVCEAEMFLDGCKIFLSGFSGHHLEKLRKIVNAGGGTRFNQINDNVSHVIIGNIIEEHVKELKELPNRPMLVSIHWLLECAKQGRQVTETEYILQDILQVEEADKENEITFKLPTNQGRRVSKVGAKKISDQHREEEDILSQYLPNATSTDTGSNDSTMIQEENPEGMCSDESKSKQEEEEEEEDDETQIDDDQQQGDGEGSGIFAKKKFVVLGFPPEQECEVREMILRQAGTVLSLSTRSIPDYAVVPITGTQVNMTVGEIVTNCWLQMSLEVDTLLEPSSNDLFTPVPIIKEAMPLRDCVISISQYCYQERDCLLHVAELLGAHCQEYFVRKAVNNLEANTHLLLRDPEGTKYMAAKKWKVPAVNRDWLLDTARSGIMQPEKNYLVDLPKNDTSATITKDENSLPRGPVKSKAVQDSVEQSIAPVQQQGDKGPKSEEIPPKTPKSVTINEKPRVQASDPEPSTSSTPVGRPVKNRTLEMVKQPIINKAVEQVKGQSVGRESTPSRILRPGFKPSFDLDDAVAALDSPGMPAGKGHRRKSSLPLDEFFHQNIANALQIKLGSTTLGGAEDEDDDIVFKEEEPAPGILHGVVICVSKKLSRKQGDYNDIAVALGAEYHWTYDEKCTHFIFQGKANDTAKEFRLAKSQGKIIVSPHWLLACQEDNKRHDETSFPQTYNPKLTLAVVASQGRTPARSMRSKVNPSSSATPLAPRPPPPVEKKEEKTKDLEADTMSDDELLRAVEIEEQSKTPGDHGTSIKQDLKKQLEEIMPASMNLRGSRRRSRRAGSSASISLAGDTTSAENTNGRRSTRSRAKRTEKNEDAGKDSGLHIEASQSVQITWDDPTSRREKEKIMAQLKRTDNSHSEPEKQVEDAQQMEEQVIKEQEEAKVKLSKADTPKAEDSPPSPTPKAPPIRLPPARPAVAPQPIDEVEDDPQQEDSTRQPAVPPKFLFTGMGNHEKIDYSALIEELGGEVKDAQYFDVSCSHIIVGNPTRNEKYLAALATGKWVLHKSYLEACRVEKAFVEEEPHEWGNRTDLSKLNETGKKMAFAATRWRMRIQDQQKEGSSVGAFDGWKVLLLVEKSKEMCFKRLLEAGGAKVLAVRPPFTSHLDASHAFFDLHKVKVKSDAVSLEELVQSGIMCLKPEYIADFLVKDPSPDPQNYIINEAKPILEKIVDQAGSAIKRRGSDLPTTPKSKRTRHR